MARSSRREPGDDLPRRRLVQAGRWAVAVVFHTNAFCPERPGSPDRPVPINNAAGVGRQDSPATFRVLFLSRRVRPVFWRTLAMCHPGMHHCHPGRSGGSPLLPRPDEILAALRMTHWLVFPENLAAYQRQGAFLLLHRVPPLPVPRSGKTCVAGSGAQRNPRPRAETKKSRVAAPRSRRSGDCDAATRHGSHDIDSGGYAVLDPRLFDLRRSAAVCRTIRTTPPVH